MPRLGGAYCFRRVRSQRKSIDWGTVGPALGGAYECYAHISSFLVCTHSSIGSLSPRSSFPSRTALMVHDKIMDNDFFNTDKHVHTSAEASAAGIFSFASTKHHDTTDYE